MINALPAAPAISFATSAASRVMRGGRVSKWKGKAASCAPFVGALAASVSQMALVTALAVGGAMIAGGTAEAACVLAGTVVTCSGAGVSTVNTATGVNNRLTNPVTEFNLLAGATLRPSPNSNGAAITQQNINAAITYNLEGQLALPIDFTTNRVYFLRPGAGSQVNIGNLTSYNTIIQTEVSGVHFTIAAGKTYNGTLNPLAFGTTSSNSVLDLYGTLDTPTAYVATLFTQGTNNTVNLYAGSQLLSPRVALISLDATNFKLNAVSSIVSGGGDPTQAAIRLIGNSALGNGFGTYTFTDTTVTGVGSSAIGLDSWVVGAVHDNTFTFNGNTVLTGTNRAAIAVDGGKDNVFNIQGNTIVKAVGMADAITAGINAFEGPNARSTTDSVTFNISGNAQILAGDNLRNSFRGNRGVDTINLSGSALMNGALSFGTENDFLSMSGGKINGSINMGADDDTFNWTDGEFIDTSSAPVFDGSTGSDTVNISTTNYNGSQTLDGGDDVSVADGFIDVLTLNGANHTVNAGMIVNWEVINLNNSTIIGDLVTSTLNVCGGSTTLTGNSAATDVKGCVSPDSITVTDNTVIANAIEGAGGSDTLNVLGNASVLTVHGGASGQDASAAADTGDTITINTTGTVGSVYGALGNDVIALNAGAVGLTSGGDGDDAITLAGAIVTGDITGDAGNDTIDLNAGEAGSVQGNDGDDAINWNAANLVTTIVQGGIGSDTVNINTAAAPISAGVVLDGGSGVLGVSGTDTLNLNSAWSGSLVGGNTINWETVNINGGNVGFSDAAVTAGTIYVNGGGTLDGSNNLVATSNVIVSTGSFLVAGNATGANAMQITGNLANEGTVQLTGPMGEEAAGDKLTVSGNYTGTAGSLLMDTVLGHSNSATDKLIIGGNSAGTTSLLVTNAGGPGALTAGDGILVVQVDGASNGVFSLGNAPLTAGAFLYKLFQGGIADPADGDWYLRSNFLPTIPTYESYAQVLLGLNNLPTLQQRVGNRFWAGEGNAVIAQGDGGPSSAPEAASSPEGEAASAFIEENAIWTRIEGAHGRYQPEVSTAGSEFDADQWKAQAGLDFMLTENGDGKLIGGLTAHYGGAAADVTASAGDGSIDATGYGLGATLTWYGNNGFYVDAQGSYSWYDSDLASDDFGMSIEGNDGGGYALSVETGKRIALGNGWTTTPQAQLVYAKVDFDDFTGPLGELVVLQQADSLKGRLGITADREAAWQGDDGMLRRSHVYTIANLHYEFLDGTEIDVSGTSFSQRQDRLWGELGLGGSYNWADDKYSVYGEADISTSLANFADSTRIAGTAGFRVRF